MAHTTNNKEQLLARVRQAPWRQARRMKRDMAVRCGTQTPIFEMMRVSLYDFIQAPCSPGMANSAAGGAGTSGGGQRPVA